MQEDLRRGNLAVLLRQVHVSGPLSRSELAARTGLNRSTVAVLVGELSAVGLVYERPPLQRLGAGRPSLVVAADSDRAWVLAVEIAAEAVTGARIGLGGRILDRVTVPSRRGAPVVPKAIRATVRRLADQLSARAPATARLIGAAVAVPGIVRRADGHVHLAPTLGWRDVAFGALLRSELSPVPVLVANEADLGVVAEHARGAAARAADVVYVSGNTGVGAGVLVGGELLAGRSGYAGEVGHMKVNPDGRRCRCGGRGCWESEVGAPALLRRAGRRAGGVARVVAAAQEGDGRASQALRETAVWMGRGAASLINVFNPELLLFGGALGAVFVAAEEAILAEVRRDVLPHAGGDALITRAGLGTDSVLLGAAELAFGSILADPAAARGLLA